MRIFAWRARLSLAFAFAFVLVVMAAGAAQAAVPPAEAATAPHLLRPETPGKAASAIPGALLYGSGPVERAPLVYVDFWGWTSDPSGEQAYLTRFLSSVGGSSWLASVNQYRGGSSANLLAGTWSDSAAVPAGPTEAQVQAEAVAAANHFGTGTSENVEIVVATPT
jgi:hypothetical protein